MKGDPVKHTATMLFVAIVCLGVGCDKDKSNRDKDKPNEANKTSAKPSDPVRVAFGIFEDKKVAACSDGTIYVASDFQ